MDSNLENAMRIASEAFLNMAEEARKLNNEMLQLREQVERREAFNQGLKQLFNEFYGGQG